VVSKQQAKQATATTVEANDKVALSTFIYAGPPGVQLDDVELELDGPLAMAGAERAQASVMTAERIAKLATPVFKYFNDWYLQR